MNKKIESFGTVHTHTHTHTHGYSLNVKNKETDKIKNVGIELLRIISMFMIVIHHIIGHGGILNSTTSLSINNNLIFLLEISCYGAVNLYALITGYVCVNSKHRWERIIELWLQVFFYTFLITLIFYIVPQNTINVGIKDLIKSILPVMSKQYWYFSSYFCLFLFIPFINKLINILTKKEHKNICVISLITFCIIAFLGRSIGGSDIFNVNNGYSFIWLTIMYIVGAYIKKYPEDLRKNNIFYLLIYIFSILLIWLSEVIISIITLKYFGNIRGNKLFITYISPFLTIGTISLFIFFSRLNINKGVNIILKFASVSFGVYLISEHNIIRTLFITNKFKEYANMPWYLMIIYTLLTAVVIYIICSLIDYIRKIIFKMLNVKDISSKIKQKIKKLYNNIENMNYVKSKE